MAKCTKCGGRGEICTSSHEERGCAGRSPCYWVTCPKCKGTGKEPGCLVSTTVCEALGKADDCNELTILREFRDEHLLHTHHGRTLVEEYYNISPALVERLRSRALHEPGVFEHLYAEHLMLVVNSITAGDYDAAIYQYRQMLAAIDQVAVEG